MQSKALRGVMIGLNFWDMQLIINPTSLYALRETYSMCILQYNIVLLHIALPRVINFVNTVTPFPKIKIVITNFFNKSEHFIET